MRERTLGILSILASALFFALATVGAKYATRTGGASTLHVTMARFIIGLIITIPMVIRNPGALRAKNRTWVGLRAVANVAAVFLFFFGIQFTTVSKANLLNMTYPVFVFAVAPFVTGERPKLRSVLLLAITFVGVWNVIRPADLSSLSRFVLGDLLAFGSAVTAGFAIAALRRARSTDSTTTIVFYVMAVGAVVNLAVVFGVPAPSPEYLLIAVGAGLMGTLGQITLTIGFAHVSAPTGSLLSTSRILVAMIFGVVLFGDSITYRTVVGALLIIGSLVAAALTDRGRVGNTGRTS